MSEPELLKSKVIELAADIFARLVSDTTKFTEKGVSMTTDPTNLAQLSFKLAGIFQKVEDGINAEALPKNVGYKLDGNDMSNWGTK